MAIVTIYGAGVSGLVAAINLAREGHEVRVLEREEQVGGSAEYEPSVHVTPLLTEETWEYIGMDLSDVFRELKQLKAYVRGKPILIPPKRVYCVEKGRRESSLEEKLYRIALDEGVSFEFESALLTIEEVERTPPNTIIATGLNYEMFEALGIPYQQTLGYHAGGRTSLEDFGFLWFDDYTTDYGYVAATNGLLFALLFSRGRFSVGGLRRFQEGIRKAEGIAFEEWHLDHGPVPTRMGDNPRLFYRDKILAGSLSGFMDPFFLFGIAGALISGKIAAVAVTDRQKALAEFERFTSGFARGLFMKTRVLDKLPARITVMGFFLSHRRLIPGWVSRSITSSFPAPVGDWIKQGLET